MSDLPTPINRHEQYLNAIANGTTDNLPTPPITREEVFLDYIARNGGGGGGTSDYAQLSNKPQINNTTLIGNKSASDLGLVGAETGKGLSTNDYTNADKSIVDGVTSALAGKVDKVTGKGLSTNDYDDTAKGIVDGVTSALAGKASTNDLGDKSNLTTTDKSSCVGAINEVNSAVNTLNRGGFFYYPVVSVNNFAAISLPKANSYTIMDVSIFAGQHIPEVTEEVTDGYRIEWISATDGYLILRLMGTYANVNVGNILSVHVIIQ